MSTTALQFGPEWMRKAPLSTPTSAVPPTALKSDRGTIPSTSPAASTGSPLPSTAAQQLQEMEGRSSSYSSILSDFGQGPITPVTGLEEDGNRPFRYSKEQMVSVWRDGGGRGDLPIDVERWEGVTQEEGREPEAVREWNDEERRFYAGPINSEPPRRRADTLSNAPLNSPVGDRPPRERRETFGKLGDAGPPSPMREKFSSSGPFSASVRGRRREEGSGDMPSPVRARNSSFGQSFSSGTPPTPGGLGAGRRAMGTFDGVLGGGGSRDEGVWSRRKPADASGVNGTGTSSAFGERRRPLGLGSGGTEGSGNATVAWSTGTSLARHGSGDEPHIPEERDVEQATNLHQPPMEHHTSTGLPISPSPEPMVRSYEADVALNGVPSAISGLSMSADQRSIGMGMGSSRGGPSPDIPRTTSTSSISPENINWYYKDPTGQMQGPFPAPTMQEWYEGNYFPDDLLLRRDGDDFLEPLQELKRRAGPHAKLFLSIIPPRTPPNLVPVSQPIPQPYSAPVLESHPNPIYGTPNYSNMDTYASSPIVSQQPGYGIPQRQPSLDSFGPISPVVPSSVRHPSPRRTIDTLYASDATPYGAIGPSALDRERARQREREEFIRREALMTQQQQIQQQQQQQSLAPGAPVQRNGYRNDTLSRDSLYDSNAPIGNLQRMLSESGHMSHPMDQQQYLPLVNPPNYGPRFQSPIQNTIQNTQMESSHGFPVQMQQQQSHQGSPWGVAPQIQYQQPTPMEPSFDPAIISSGPQMGGPRSPFEVSQPQFQHNISFGQQEPMQEPQQTTNVAWQTQAYQPQEHWAPLPPQQHVPSVPEPEPPIKPASPVIPPAHEAVEIPEWTEAPSITDSGLANVVPVNSPQVPAPIARPRGESLVQVPKPTPATTEPKIAAPLPAPLNTTSASTTVTAPISSPVTAVSPAPPVAVPTPSSAVGIPKPAPWASAVSPVDDKAKGNPATSLRQIQEAEARRAEARKAAEKAERAKRAAATPATPAVEEAVPATQSWGLAAPVASRAAAPAPEPTAPAAPWSKTGPAPKKTLKEIQEEEEKRKSQAAAAAVVAAAHQGLPAVAAAAKRGYADSAKTTTSSGVWSTVGPGGKIAAAPAAVRPTPVAQASVSAARSPAALAQATTAARSVPTPQLAKTPAKVASPAPNESDPLVPSAEFMRWLRDALKGLNAGVNVDEYMHMLLSFALDPSPAVVEIIQESIYGNSSTLDGRRFAAEFISKRKADAALKKAGGSTARTSLADVVKAQPKPASPDWNFRTVVKKKGKGKN